MTTDEKVKMIEEELLQIKDELGQMMVDIRAFIMEAKNPLRPYERQKTPDEGLEKGVEEHDSRKED